MLEVVLSCPSPMRFSYPDTCRWFAERGLPLYCSKIFLGIIRVIKSTTVTNVDTGTVLHDRAMRNLHIDENAFVPVMVHELRRH